MKCRSLFIFLSLLCIASWACQAKILNGYERDIKTARISLDALIKLLAKPNLTNQKRRNLQRLIKQHEGFITYYRLTQLVLEEFEMVSSNLYQQVDTLQDLTGRKVDVYVKVVPAESTRAKAWGTTHIAQSINDRHQYVSEFGENTVSIKIWMNNNAVFVLAHEFGHAKYQVMNLASYMLYHKNTYRNNFDKDNVGHAPHDPSGNESLKFEQIFHDDYINFLKSGGRLRLLTVSRKKVRSVNMEL